MRAGVRAWMALAPAAACAAGLAGPRYAWKPGEQYVYSVRYEAALEGAVEIRTGTVVYSAASAGPAISLSSRSELTARRRTREGRPLPAEGDSPLGRLRIGSAGMREQVTVDNRGVVLRSMEAAALPCSLTSPARLMLETLAPEAQAAWTIERDCLLVVEEAGTGGGALSAPPPAAQLPARELSAYTRREPAGEGLPIEKEYRLQTRESLGGAPRIEITGRGRLEFDLTAGCFRSLEFAGSLAETGREGTRRTPLTVSYRLLLGPDREAALAALSGMPAPPAVLSPEAHARTLADLRSAERPRRIGALERLSAALPGAAQAEMAAAIAALAGTPDPAIRLAAVRALRRWATAAEAPVLIRLLEAEDLGTRLAAMDALAGLRLAQGAQALAERVRVGRDRFFAGRALQSMGAPAEASVLALLREQDAAVRLEACRILKEIGGRASIAPLEEAVRDADRGVALTAESALEAVRARAR